LSSCSTLLSRVAAVLCADMTTASPTADLAGPPSLDPTQFSVEPAASDYASQSFRFRSHREERDLWLEALPLVEDDQKRIDRFVRCGTDAWLQFSPSTGRYRVRSNVCKMRICPICSLHHKRRASDLIASVIRATAAEPGYAWKFVTLTLKHSTRPLREQHDRLRQSFRKLRQRKIWKQSARCGFAVIETTFNRSTGLWHGHLHVLVHSPYLAQQDLSDAWLSITGDSFIVDIRSVKTTDGAIRYLTGYLGKPPSIASLDRPVQRLGEFYVAINRQKLLIRFGKLPEISDEDSDGGDDPIDWTPLCPLPSLLSSARTGDPASIAILKLLTGASHASTQPQPSDTS